MVAEERVIFMSCCPSILKMGLEREERNGRKTLSACACSLVCRLNEAKDRRVGEFVIIQLAMISRIVVLSSIIISPLYTLYTLNTNCIHTNCILQESAGMNLLKVSAG